ncbi:MAG: glycerophosphodiester phosphodiesterase [Chloroflexota bacterium]
MAIHLILAAEIFALLILAEPSRSAPVHSYYSADLHYPLVVAHQGGDGLWPGNTMYAFRQAVNLGVDAIETDVRISDDGALVLMHDGRLEHTTNGSGRIEAMSLAEIQKLDAGYRWSLDDGVTFPFRGQNLAIPTLEQVFQSFSDVRFVLDVKETGNQIEERLCALIWAYQMEHRVVVAAVSDGVVDKFRKVCPEVATAAAFGDVAAFVFPQRVNLEGWFPPHYESLQGPYDPFGLYRKLVITAGYIQDAHARNVKVEPWADDAETMQHYIDIGVDGIITDHPDVLLELLGRGER